jgi:DNA-binding LacI/PurR family transcriptional regulator
MAGFHQSTLRQVAARAGVSVMTASRAIRNQSTVAPDTKERILRVAKELHYRPNPLVSALMSYRRASKAIRQTSTLGLITTFPSRNGWKEARINQLFHEGAVEACARHGYKLEVFWLREPNMTSRRLDKILYSRNIHGLLIAPLPVALGHLRLDWDQYSAVALGYSLAWPRLHRAVNHQFRSMRSALRQLRKMGYKRIGLALKSSIDERVEHHYSGGFLVDQSRMPMSNQVPLHLVADKEWDEANFARWFRKNKPEVVVTHHEETLGWLAGLGTKVPQETGLVHLNCPDRSGKFAGIYQNGMAVGSAAVDFLVAMLQRNERGIPQLAHTILVDGTWIEGKTIISRNCYSSSAGLPH